ncbi:MAG: site-specific integrase [Anaerolineales bacterium]|nr:site-specific integrase [Anaerolineales bacterium]
MMKLSDFLAASYDTGSYFYTLQKFLNKAIKRQLSSSSITHLFYSLYPLGEWLHNCPIAEVNSRVVDRYEDGLWLSYAPSTIRGHVGDIQQFARWCKKRKLSKNFAKKLKKPKHRGRTGYIPSDTELLEVIRATRDSLEDVVYRDVFGRLAVVTDELDDADKRAIRDLFILAFLYETGCRVGELVKMPQRTMDKVEFENGVAMVTLRGKTKFSDYWFTVRVMELWQLWCCVRDDNSKYAVVGWRLGEEAQRLRPNGVSQMIVRRSTLVGRTFRAHVFRHAKAKRVRRQSGLEMAQMLLDHSSSTMTAVYAAPDAKEVAAIVKKSGLVDLW